MIVAISNLIRIAIPAVLINILFFFGTSSAQIEDLKKSFFPLIPGSYWVTQDTFFNHEAEIAAQEGGMNPFTIKTDSVKQLIATNDGLRIQMISRIGTDNKNETCYEYFISKNGLIKKYSINNQTIKNAVPMWKLFPQKSDTVFELGSYKRILMYDSLSNDSTLTLLPKWKSENPACEPAIYKFKKGIGLIGQIYPTTANRLIEYRIGNGPIVKKHWLMEAPEKK
jgi:hypothetical protein